MSNIMYTSLKLSKKLKENGCELESDYIHTEIWSSSLGKREPYLERKIDIDTEHYSYNHIAPAYDILWDICIKYAKNFFLEWERNTRELLFLIQTNKSQKLIEDYIWDNCRFNNKNKENK